MGAAFLEAPSVLLKDLATHRHRDLIGLIASLLLDNCTSGERGWTWGLSPPGEAA